MHRSRVKFKLKIFGVPQEWIYSFDIDSYKENHFGLRTIQLTNRHLERNKFVNRGLRAVINGIGLCGEGEKSMMHFENIQKSK